MTLEHSFLFMRYYIISDLSVFIILTCIKNRLQWPAAGSLFFCSCKGMMTCRGKQHDFVLNITCWQLNPFTEYATINMLPDVVIGG